MRTPQGYSRRMQFRDSLTSTHTSEPGMYSLTPAWCCSWAALTTRRKKRKSKRETERRICKKHKCPGATQSITSKGHTSSGEKVEGNEPAYVMKNSESIDWNLLYFLTSWEPIIFASTNRFMTYVNGKQKLSRKWASSAEMPRSVTLQSPHLRHLCNETRPATSTLKAPSFPPLRMTITRWRQLLWECTALPFASRLCQSRFPAGSPLFWALQPHLSTTVTQKVAFQHHIPLKPYLVSPGQREELPSVGPSGTLCPPPTIMTMITRL